MSENIMKKYISLASLPLLFCLWSGSARATPSFEASVCAGFCVTITLDEAGNGTLTNTAGFNSGVPFDVRPDPGPGGLSAVLFYGLLNPPGLVGGDVILLEPGSLG